MPLRTSFRRTRFRAKDADWPAEQTGTGIRLRSIERMLVVVNCPRESGPMTTVSPEWITPGRSFQTVGFMWEVKCELTAFDNTRHYSTNKRDRESIVDMKLKRRFGIVVAVMGKDVEESSNQI